MPITTVATNDVLTASHFNTNYRDQVVSTTTSGAKPAGTEGQLIYLTDTNQLQLYNGAAWETLYQQGGWTAYTPQIDQGATTNIAKTTSYAKYFRMGSLVIAQGGITITGTGTGSAVVTMTLPTTAASAVVIGIGTAEIYDSSATTRYEGMAELLTTTTLQIVNSATGANALGTASFTAALANNDILRWSVSYEST